jgi:hypothetical protein
LLQKVENNQQQREILRHKIEHNQQQREILRQKVAQRKEKIRQEMARRKQIVADVVKELLELPFVKNSMGNFKV